MRSVTLLAVLILSVVLTSCDETASTVTRSQPPPKASGLNVPDWLIGTWFSFGVTAATSRSEARARLPSESSCWQFEKDSIVHNLLSTFVNATHQFGKTRAVGKVTGSNSYTLLADLEIDYDDFGREITREYLFEARFSRQTKTTMEVIKR